jgi:hypothetical protein
MRRGIIYSFGVVLLWLGSLVSSEAQLEVGCRTKAAVFLQFEPVVVQLDVANNTSRDLVIGGKEANAFLTCEIRNARNERIEPHKRPMQVITISAREHFSEEINISPYYDLRDIDSYTLRMRVEFLDRYFYSKNCYFDVRKGEELLSIVSEYDGTFRTYSLEAVVRDRQEKLFLRIEDDATCYGVIELGKIIKLYKPTLMADYDGNVHALFHSGPSEYTEVTVSGDGEIIKRSVRGTQIGMPEMSRDEAGSVSVAQPYEDE